MRRTNLFFKVEVEHDPKETPERLAAEIRRQIVRVYGVQRAELSSYTAAED